jgi:hypothetical protein
VRIPKAETKMETLKWRMYSGEIRDRMQLIRQRRVVIMYGYGVSGDVSDFSGGWREETRVYSI